MALGILKAAWAGPALHGALADVDGLVWMSRRFNAEKAIDAAVHRTGEDETAWRYRDATWSMVIAGVDPEPANRDLIRRWARDYWAALHPHSAGGAYINFMMDEGVERIRGTYGGNYDRLQSVKAKYDAGNLFCVNQNIVPANEVSSTEGPERASPSHTNPVGGDA